MTCMPAFLQCVPPPHAHCPFIHTASCFLSPLTVALHCWLKCLCFRRRRADDRAPLSAPKNLTRAHNRKTSQVRVSGIVRGTFADRLPTCNKIRAHWCVPQQQKLKKCMAIKGPSTHSFLCIPQSPRHLFVWHNKCNLQLDTTLTHLSLPPQAWSLSFPNTPTQSLTSNNTGTLKKCPWLQVNSPPALVSLSQAFNANHKKLSVYSLWLTTFIPDVHHWLNH